MKAWLILKQKTPLNRYETDRIIEESSGQISLVLQQEIDILVDRMDRKSIRYRSKVTDLPDIVIPRMGSGIDYFGLSLLRHCERMGVRMMNSSLSIESTGDKLWASQIFAENNLPMPKTLLVKYPVDSKIVKKQIGFPAVVKIYTGSYGRGVYLVHNEQEFIDFIEFAHGIKHDQAIIVQEYIADRPGEDIRVYVIGNRVLGAMKRKSTDGSFKANITRGGIGETFPVNSQIEQLSLQAAGALNLDIAGVDLLFNGDSYKLCEVNSAPGFKGFEKYTGINVAKQVVEHARYLCK
jgi:gamma-F420-2:alpha-L-glutamate ligase